MKRFYHGKEYFLSQVAGIIRILNKSETGSENPVSEFVNEIGEFPFVQLHLFVFQFSGTILL
jgi:hypothetical protein